MASQQAAQQVTSTMAGQVTGATGNNAAGSSATTAATVAASSAAEDSTTGAPVPESTTGASVPESTTGASVPESTTGASVPESSTGAPAPESTTGAPAPESTSGAPSTTAKPINNSNNNKKYESRGTFAGDKGSVSKPQLFLQALVNYLDEQLAYDLNSHVHPSSRLEAGSVVAVVVVDELSVKGDLDALFAAGLCFINHDGSRWCTTGFQV